jgi:hypothetical protein
MNLAQVMILLMGCRQVEGCDKGHGVHSSLSEVILTFLTEVGSNQGWVVRRLQKVGGGASLRIIMLGASRHFDGLEVSKWTTTPFAQSS